MALVSMYVCECIYVRMYVCMYVCAYVCMCVCAYSEIQDFSKHHKIQCAFKWTPT